MYDVYARIEHWPLSVWAREDPYAYFIALIGHAWGMALLIGAGVVICLRLLGIGRAAALRRFRGFFVLMWSGAVLAIASGTVLLVAYPAKALTNPVFAIKFACLISAALLMRRLSRSAMTSVAPDEPLPRWIRATAALALLLWLGSVAAGKLLLHTYHVLTVT